MNKDGKYVYLYKKEEPNRYFRYNLASKQFERVNIYKTTDNKITPVKVANIRQWFHKHIIKTDNPLFARMFIYNKSRADLALYKNPVRYIEAFNSEYSQAVEEWYNSGIIIEEVENIFNKAIKDEHARTPKHYKYVDIRPNEFEKSMLKIIKDIGTVTLGALHKFSDINEQTLRKYEQLYKAQRNPHYQNIFKFRGGFNDEEYDIFNFDNYAARRYRNRLLDVINEFNLDIDALCRFLDRLRRVEGCDISDLTEGYHYRDYLRMEKELNNQNVSKIDKYPKNWLTTFRRTKRNYQDMKKIIDEGKFIKEVHKHDNLLYNGKKFSIILPNKPDDVRKEGSTLKHCVASYVDYIVEGKTTIAFCRKNEDINEPYVTIEVLDGKLTQAYAYQDSKPDKEALKFLEKWAKEKDVEISWGWRKPY